MKQKHSIGYNLAFFIATFFGIGTVKKAPGTWGSFATFPVFLPISYGIISFFSTPEVIPATLIKQIVISLVLVFAIIFIGGTFATSYYLKATGKTDPGEVVIDEVAGQYLTVFLALPMLAFFIEAEPIMSQTIGLAIFMLLCFLFFRLFDILKPWPISWCDRNIKGAFGVMFDDIVAGIFAAGLVYLVTFLVILSPYGPLFLS